MDYTGEEKKRGSPCGANTSIIGKKKPKFFFFFNKIPSATYQLVTIKVGFYVSLSFAVGSRYASFVFQSITGNI